MNPTGIDESWSFAPISELKRLGVLVVSLYLSWDPSKNMTPAKVKALHQAGIGVIFNWESQAGAPLKGRQQGLTDATEALRQAKAQITAVGYAPKNRASIYNSCDTDVSLAQIQGPCAAYYRATASVYRPAGFGNGAYGEKDLIAYLAANSITDSEWQTYAWSRGELSPAADFYQYLNGQKIGGASVDFDKVIHPADLGAWWPPTHPLNTANPTTGDLLMAMTDDQLNAKFAALGKAVANANARLVDALNGDENDPGAGLRDLSRKVNALEDKVDKILAAVQK